LVLINIETNFTKQLKSSDSNAMVEFSLLRAIQGINDWILSSQLLSLIFYLLVFLES